ncbi:GSCFA domain-containing protein [Aestuariibaculum suncheonense]|uniref:GSCFA domain-containing protein n=1 Tax=Aestuariibaculum suncheonense TaxID=1028745 RepID=A0A8J6QAA7_9FLAO|nr:GSCFA domain-containing protein [Aestuariibaculum suncheonense]MBD0836005.1 GSCFA domain-containing protein [Aestuariibaculum suncheonense]
MKFQTEIPLKPQTDSLIDYHSNVLLLGSCFVENIGEKFSYFKFRSLQNPLGILFNPKAIENLVRRSIQNENYTESDLLFHNEQWHCFDAHSKLSHPSKEDLLKNLNETIKQTREQICSSTHVIITLGTAWAYRYKKTGAFVANCHKVPQKQFDKVLLTCDEVRESLEHIKSSIQSVNPKTNIIFTVSPVRHIKDGFVENTQSKAHLISAIHQLVNQKEVFYFPSYEIMMDELRDYRFYADDMLHPSSVAIDYIWKKFVSVWVSNDAKETMDAVNDVQKGLQHKPFNPNSEAHKTFLERLKAKKETLESNFSYIKF